MAARVSPDLLRGVEELLDAREQQYEVADDYYSGEAGEIFASPRVRRMLNRSGADRIDDFNYSSIPVRVISHRLQVNSALVVPDDDPDTPEPSEQTVADAQAALARVIRRNQLDVETPSLIKNVSRHGDAYLFVWPVTEAEIGTDPAEIQQGQDALDEDELDDGLDEDELDEQLFPQATTPAGKVVGVDIRVNTAHTVRMFYDEEDPLLPKYVIKVWTYDEWSGAGRKIEVTRANLYYVDRVERWYSSGKEEGMATWRRFDLDGRPWQIPNPWGRLPFFHLRNDRPYGTPEHWNAIGPQQMLNKLVKSHAGIIDWQCFPQRYYMADPRVDDPLSNSVDPFHPEDDDDDPEDEGNVSSLESSPSAVWKLYGSGAGQFAAADPGVFLGPFDRYVRSMAELTDIAQHHFSKSGSDVPSGVSLRVLDRPLTSLVKDRQRAYGGVLSDAYTHALRLLGFQGVTVQIGWEPAESITDPEGWQVLEAKRRNGVPTEVALAESGYPAEQVAQWLGQSESVEFERRVQILSSLGIAAQSLGAAATMGVMDPIQVKQLFDRVLGVTASEIENELPEGEQ